MPKIKYAKDDISNVLTIPTISNMACVFQLFQICQLTKLADRAIDHACDRKNAEITLKTFVIFFKVVEVKMVQVSLSQDIVISCMETFCVRNGYFQTRTIP